MLEAFYRFKNMRNMLTNRNMLTETLNAEKIPDSIPSNMQFRHALREPHHPGSQDLLCIHPTLN